MKQLTQSQKEELQRILELLKQKQNPDQLSKKEFTDAFAKVADLVLKADKRNKEFYLKLEETYKLLLEKNKETYDSNFTELKDYLKKEHKEMYQEHEKMVKKIDKRLTELKDGKTPVAGIDFPIPLNGKNPDPKEIVPLVLAELPNEELKIEDVKGLKEELERIKQIRSRGNLGMKKITYSRSHDMSDQVDGAKRVFTLPIKTISVQAVRISYFPYNLRKNVDWTINGNNLTLTSEIATPPLTHTIIADIEVPFYY